MRRGTRRSSVLAAAALTAVVAASCTSGAARSSPSTTTGSTTTTAPAGSTTTVATPTVGSQVKVAALSGLSVIDQTHAYALIGPRYYSTTGAVGVAATVDGGAHWTAVATQQTLQPLSYESGLVFATAQRGWTWQAGPSSCCTDTSAPTTRPLMATGDGGHTWKAVPGITGVEQVLSLGQSVWVVTQPGSAGAATAPVVLWTSSDGGATWARSTAATPPVRSLVRVTASTAYGLGQTGIVTTTDGGTSWTAVGTMPCSSARLDLTTLTHLSAGGVGDLWLACVSQPETSLQAKQLYRSSDGGAHWHLAASVPLGGVAPGGSTPVVGQISGRGFVQQLTALSPEQAVLALDRGGLFGTTDGGVDWTAVGPAAQAAVVSVTSAGIGLALLDGAPWHTTDGVHWAPVG